MGPIPSLDPQSKLRVLLTNTSLVHWAGSELFVRDVAVELLKRGHTPVIYSPRLGELAQEIRGATIPVVDDLNSISMTPHIIHGHHHLETMTALSHFESVPAVFFCHGMLPWEEIPPHHPRIVRYVAISEAIQDRLLYEHGIPDQKILTFSNFVDLEKFKPRSSPLPPVPKRALIFSNYASENNYIGLVREACDQHNISLNIVGMGYGNPSSHPEEILESYDIIFARGRAALEGMAVGAAVICCDIEGAGSMVTSENLGWYRHNNLGIRTLNRPITVELLSEEISRYDPVDAAKVSQAIRENAGLESAVDQILEIYGKTLQAWKESPTNEDGNISEGQAMAAYLKWISESVPYKLTSEIQRLSDQTKILQSEIHRLSDQAKILQDELDNIKSTLTWKLYQRLTSWAFLRNTYHLLVSPLKQRRTKQQLKRK